MKSSPANIERKPPESGYRSGWLRWTEFAAFLVLAVSAALGMLPTVRLMAAKSLWLDEFIGVLSFSSKGPGYVLTCYPFPDHVFFSLLNSLTPGAASVLPWRARLWSFIAVAAMIGVSVAFFSRRRRWLECGLFLQMLASNAVALNLFLQARGYGLTALAALLSSLACVRYFEDRSRASIVTIAACTVLGTYAVTSYVFLALPLLVILGAAARDRRWWKALAFSVAAIALLHAPIAFELWAVMREYAANYGKNYTGWSSVAATLCTYGIDLPAWAMAAVLGALVIFHWFADCRAGRVLLSAAVVFFVICLKMETPVLRATSFVVFPIAIAGLDALTHRTPGSFRPLLAVAFFIPLAFANLHAFRSFHPLPYEDWLGAAEFIKNHWAPGTTVFVGADYRPQFMQACLGPAYPLTRVFDPEAFAANTLVAVDPGLRLNRPGFAIPPRAWQHRIPQIHNGACVVYSGQRERPGGVSVQ